tara:strand:+ start:21334 stop:21900 length:567 start_codon:yes stop_codon:yes gene_type:complete
MSLLIIGVVLWCSVHLIPSLATGLKQGLVGTLGKKGYRGVFSLAILASLVLIVMGWRSSPEVYIYALPAWSRPAGLVLMMISFALLGAAHYKTGIRRFISHPMLAGVVAWSVSHLLTNGTMRAWVLFGGLGLWAALEIVLINRRDGAPEPVVSPGPGAELGGLAISAVIFAIAFFLHPYFAGVPILLR